MASTSENKHQTYSRKQKSLGLLCSNFLKLYDREGVESIGLDEAAIHLGVERRRIYDIVNVLDSVGVLSRKAKNRYSWKGFDGIPKALDDLKKEASTENCGAAFAAIKGCKKELHDDGEDENTLDLSGGETSQENASFNSLHPETSFSKGKMDNRREKSLGLLTRNFVKLFLTSNVDIVSLDEAANLLLGDISGSSLMRNNSAAKVRRLYDIANVLSSLNLIEKTHQLDTKKPAFRWLGFNGRPNTDAMLCLKPTNMERPIKRQFGTVVTNLDIADRIKSTSLKGKPTKERVEKENLSVQKQCVNQMGKRQKNQEAGTKGYDFGPFHPFLHDAEKNCSRSARDLEALATYRPQYHNQALSDLFSHYVDAWKSWYTEVAQANNLHPKTNSLQQPS